jgi:hypothetical protein
LIKAGSEITCRIVMLAMVTVATVLASSSLVFSEEQNYLQVKSESKVETLPGELVITALRIINPESQKMLFDLEIECPEGWQVISGEGRVEIDGNADISRLASFFVPVKARAEEYTVNFVLKSTEGAILQKQPISVNVLPSPRIELSDLVNFKRNTIAGETARFDYQILNSGNVPVTVMLNVQMSRGTVSLYPEEKIKLDVGESRKVSIEVILDDDFEELTAVALNLIALVISDNKVVVEATKEATSKVEVYPRGSYDVDEFHYLPGKVKLKGTIGDRGETRSDWQMAFSLDGPLKDDGSDDFSLLYRGPAPDRKNPFYSKDEEFHISYNNDDFGIYVGDGNYNLSPLVDISRDGRGIELESKSDSINLDTYLAYPDRSPSQENVIGVDMGFPIDENNEISLLYFNSDVKKPFSSRIDDRTIMGIRGEFGDGDNLDIDMEFAQGGIDAAIGRDYAYRFDGKYRDDEFNINARRIFAGPGFGGYYRDMNLTEFSTSIPVAPGLRIHGEWKDQQRNFNRIEENFSSIRDKDISMGLGYSAGHSSSLTADYIFKSRAELGDDSRYNRNAKFWRINASRTFGELILSARFEFGENENRILGETVNHISQLGSFSWEIDRNLTLFGFVSSMKGDFFDDQDRKTTRSGIHFKYSPRKDTLLTSGLNLEMVRDSFRRIYVPFSFKYQFGDGDQIEVRGRYSNTERSGLKRDDSAVMVEYTIPFSVKVDRKSGYCTLTGYIRDITTGEPLMGVLVHTENRADLTDETGQYVIKDLVLGKNTVTVNLSNLSYQHITVPASPLTLDLAEGKTQVDFNVVTAGSISGNVRMAFADGSTGSDGLEGIMVELISEVGSEFRLTDDAGRFAFELLPPGHYKVVIDQKNLPDYTHLEMDKYEFDLTAGMEIDIDAKVMEDLVKVRIIKKDEITLTK